MAQYDVLIIGGAGHIGLPLGLLLADKGVNVGLLDTDEERCAQIAAGKMPFLEFGADPVLERVVGKTLHISKGLQDIAASETVIITIGTPLDEYRNPSLMPILTLAGDMLPYLQRDQHVMLRSTLFPGTTEQLARFFKENAADVQLSFCPERILQAQAMTEYGSLAQIISGNSTAATAHAENLFSTLGVRCVTVDYLEAELAKLFSNSWRYIQFAIANQFYAISAKHGVDFERIHHAVTNGYDRAGDMPKPGFAAGPCLFKDTMQLAAYCSDNFALGREAARINEGLPAVFVEQLQAMTNLVGARVGILGMAFKGDCDDTRDSLSFKLRKLLKFHGAEVFCSDEYVDDSDFLSIDQLFETCSHVVVGAPHSAYKGIVAPAGVEVLDPWGIVASAEAGDGA